MSGSTCFSHRVRSLQSTLDYDLDQRPCGASENSNDVFSCCYPGDTCMEGNICQAATKSGNGTGYYLAGCTDPNYADPACAQHCFDQSLPDIKYNDSSSNWSCCVSGIFSLRCDQESNEDWEAPAPDALQQKAIIPSSATVKGWKPSITPSSSTTSSQTPTISAESSTGTPSNVPNADPGLSTDAKVGIISAAVILALALFVAGAFFLYRRRRRSREANGNGAFARIPEKPVRSSKDFQTHSDLAKVNAVAPYAGYYRTVTEVPANVRLHEMHGRSIMEMPQQSAAAEMPTSPQRHGG